MLSVACSFLLVIHWACGTGESTKCRGVCVCGCQDAAAPTVRAPFFRNADTWIGVGGGAAVRLADALQWRQQPLQPHRWTCVKESMVKTGQPGTPPQPTLLTTPQRPTLAFFSIGADHNLPTTPRPRRKSTPWRQEDPNRALCELPAGIHRPSCPPRHHSPHPP